jgi:predicted DNA-binding transcriptional regulator AlpA
VKPSSPELPEYLSTTDVAKLFGVCRNSILGWWRGGQLPPPLHLGRRCYRWPRVVILKHLETLGRRSRRKVVPM